MMMVSPTDEESSKVMTEEDIEFFGNVLSLKGSDTEMDAAIKARDVPSINARLCALHAEHEAIDADERVQDAEAARRGESHRYDHEFMWHVAISYDHLVWKLDKQSPART